MKAVDLRPGSAVRMDGKLYVVTKFEHRTPGNLRAFIQAKLRDVMNGGYIEKRFASSDELEGITLDRRQCEYLYAEADSFVFMDCDNFDQFNVPAEVAGDAMLYLRPNAQTTIMFLEENPLSVELPSAVELTVTETPPGIKGATATNQLKEATLETGLKTRVPPFIAEGELIKVSTADGSYLSRAKE
ncbi:MAG: elongation factor P [Phycisphaerales bacterium]|nr:elongation factor P [Phycisphaerales bacterium]MCA9305403.1 elongation factor P [Phycisphaerales bacterium]